VTHARLRRLSALVGWALYLVAGVGLLLHWGFVVWLLTGAGMLAIQWSYGFGRRKPSQGQREPKPRSMLARDVKRLFQL
jgi:Flp pilus assembly protein TadB